MSQHFTHLHLHTDYSLLDGAITIERLVKFGKQHNFKALAMSDHGNIFGAVKFFQHCIKAGIKPILGMEAYFTEDVTIKSVENKYYHLILIVENAQGYKNLCKLISFAYQEGFYFKPRIDYHILEQYHEGLMVSSACLGGHIPQLLMQDNYEQANQRVDWFLKTFGPERFYLEVQPDDQKDQKILNQKLFDLAQKRGLQVLATGDCHYVSAEDREAHEIMLSIQTHHKLTDPDRFTFGDCRAHIRTQEEMLEIFKEHPDAVWNSGKIADRCTFNFETGKLFFPQYQIPESYTQESYFEKLCHAGLKELFELGRIDHEQKELYTQRLQLEIDLIIKMGFVGYFLVVSDFMQWARAQNIPVGSRGSVAGSLVAWALQITGIDPIKYNLLFERFLNPERISMPDIDIDFCIEGREKVIQYVKDTYGHDKVCQIITFGTMMAKGVIKDVARVLGFPFDDSNTLTNLIPDQLKITLTEALEQEPQLKELCEKNSQIAHLFDVAFRLEGITRHASKHAAGIVISPEPISDVLPVYIPPKTTDLVTQYAMTELESLGFLKMDFLGLKTLTHIQKTINLIKKNHQVDIDITRISLNDAKSYALLCRGETSGIFQLESEGIKDVLKRVQPAVFEDIIAINALYRPGPLGSGMVDDFIERKHGRQKIVYLFDELELILQETYGVIVYQEQVMKIASTIGGYRLGEADILRRAMGKKKAEEMAKQQSIFVERAVTKNFDEKKARELFDLMAYFAGYGFNKSHSAVYALIAYQTAFLKAHYPAEFMACLISLEASDAEKMAFYVQEAKDCGLKVLPPDINHSLVYFDVIDQSLRFGLQGIKNVGLTAIENILKEREKKPFNDLLDFCTRIDLRTCNKRVMESLICAGALDSLPGFRAQKHDELAKVMDYALDKKRAAATGQLGLFAATQILKTENAPLKEENYVFVDIPEWPITTKLDKEKEVLGLYISAQPLDAYNKQLQWIKPLTFEQAFKQKGIVLCCGVIKNHKIVTTKKGDRMAFLACEDRISKAEIIIFPQLFASINQWLDHYSIFLIKGTIDDLSDICKIKAHLCIPLDLLFTQPIIQRLQITLSQYIAEQHIQEIKNAFTSGTTPLDVLFAENNKTLKLALKQKIQVTESLVQLLDQHNITINFVL
ncbi:MAG: DNA polymerase III subunit alpha [Candidatus Babeliaceae bacterium]